MALILLILQPLKSIISMTANSKNRSFSLMRYICPRCGGEVVCVQIKPGGWFVGFGPLGCIVGLLTFLFMTRTRMQWQCRSCGLVCSLPISPSIPLPRRAREPTAAEVKRQRELNDYYHRKTVLKYVRYREDYNDD